MIRYGQAKSTPELCSTKWKALRDKFVKELRKVRTRKSGDEGPPYVSPWKLYGILTFLTDSVKHRSTFMSITLYKYVYILAYLFGACISILYRTETNFEVQSREPTPQDSPCSHVSSLEDASASFSTDELILTSGSFSTPDDQRTTKSVSENPVDERQPKRFRKGHNDDIIDKMLMHNLSQMSAANDDEEELFARQIAATLRRFTNRQKAFAKLRIQSVLIDVEFSPEEQHSVPHTYGYGQFQ